jgi:hypothetical protein
MIRDVLKKNLQFCWELEQASAEDRHNKNEAGSQNNFCSYLVPFFLSEFLGSSASTDPIMSTDTYLWILSRPRSLLY